MKTLSVILVVAALSSTCLLLGCAQKKEATEPVDTAALDRAQNGFIKISYSVDMYDSDIDDQPAGVFALATDKVQKKLDSFPDTKMAEALIVPQLGGYRLVFLSERRLTEKEYATLRDMSSAAIRDAKPQWRQIAEKQGRANQRLQGTPESVPSSSTEPEARRP